MTIAAAAAAVAALIFPAAGLVTLLLGRLTMIFLRLPAKNDNIAQGGAGYESVEEARVSEDDRVLLDFEGALLKSWSRFPYFMLVAIEAGSPLRGLLLLLSVPLAWLLRALFTHEAELHLFTLIALGGLKASAVEAVSRAVLAKFYLENLHPRVFQVFKSCGKRHLLTSLPSIMVEPAAAHYLEAAVTGTEVQVSAGGYCTGRIKMLVTSDNKARLVNERFKAQQLPTVGIMAGGTSRKDFLNVCKKRYLFDGRVGQEEKVSKMEYIKPLVFHDGRLVHTPTPLHCLVIALWLPLAVPLAIIRVIVGLALPKPLALAADALLGVSVRVKGSGPPRLESGVLFVCTHRTLLDPVFISVARTRNVTTVTYSVSPVSEVLSPIRTARLTRCREQDARTMSNLLSIGDLAVCPEGTTCREPFLLRFSALFAELTDRVVPVAVTSKMGMFHATTARGWKALDPLFFFMNPWPGYEVEFLQQIAREETCSGGGRTSHQVANYVQKRLADALGYQCTNLTRKDKYRMLVGNDGLVKSTTPASSAESKSLNMLLWKS